MRKMNKPSCYGYTRAKIVYLYYGRYSGSQCLKSKVIFILEFGVNLHDMIYED